MAQDLRCKILSATANHLPEEVNTKVPGPVLWKPGEAETGRGKPLCVFLKALMKHSVFLFECSINEEPFQTIFDTLSKGR